MSKKQDKRAQVTILVIIALIIVVAIALIFSVMKKSSPIISASDDPKGYMEKCIKDSLEKSSKIIIESNGYENKNDNYILYNGEKVPYLCKSSMFYYPCINQEPMLIEKIRKQILDKTKKDAEECFNKLVKALENKNNKVVLSSNSNIEIVFSSNKLYAYIYRRLSIQKEEDYRVIDSFSGEIQSSLYNLFNTARQIVNYESTLCEFNNDNWMANFGDISIKKFIASEGTKVYTITDKVTEQEINIAVKGCVMPAGI